MNGRIVARIVLAIVLLLAVAGIAYYAYNVGLAQGALATDRGGAVAPGTQAPGTLPSPYGRGPFFYRPFGFGFGFLGCLFPLLFFALFLLIVRGLFWGGRRYWGGHGSWDNGVPPRFEEWHRKAHEPKPEA